MESCNCLENKKPCKDDCKKPSREGYRRVKRKKIVHIKGPLLVPKSVAIKYGRRKTDINVYSYLFKDAATDNYGVGKKPSESKGEPSIEQDRVKSLSADTYDASDKPIEQVYVKSINKVTSEFDDRPPATIILHQANPQPENYPEDNKSTHDHNISIAYSVENKLDLQLETTSIQNNLVKRSLEKTNQEMKTPQSQASLNFRREKYLEYGDFDSNLTIISHVHENPVGFCAKLKAKLKKIFTCSG